LRRKWDLAHSLQNVLDRIRGHIQELADLKGPAPVVLERLETWYRDLAPDSVAALRSLVDLLRHHGVDSDRVELDLGFGRGIGFYSRMIFELVAPTSQGPVAVGGGGRYDGLARIFGGDRDDHGVGFAFGLERLANVLTRTGDQTGPPVTLLVAASAESLPTALGLAVALREDGHRVETYLNAGRPNTKEVDVAGHSLEERHRAFVVVGAMEDHESISLAEIGKEGPTRCVSREELTAFLRALSAGKTQ
jgi:histidyl-tRNA synthetase